MPPTPAPQGGYIAPLLPTSAARRVPGGRVALLYALLQRDGPATPKELSRRTGIALASVRRYLRDGCPQFFVVLEAGRHGPGGAGLFGAAGVHQPEPLTAVQAIAPLPVRRRESTPRRLRRVAQIDAAALTYCRVALSQLVRALDAYLAGDALADVLDLPLAAARTALAETAPPTPATVSIGAVA
jgi:hypothetical protein